jgi:hypothetical protein
MKRNSVSTNYVFHKIIKQRKRLHKLDLQNTLPVIQLKELHNKKTNYNEEKER